MNNADPCEGLSLEYTALGLLMAGPAHGYALHREFNRQFGALWRAGRSHLYAALKSLESAGFVEASTEAQGSRPPRRVLHVTPAGVSAFLAWVGQPTPHMRQIRAEFLAKLRFYEILSLPEPQSLIDRQVALCQARLAELAQEAQADEDPGALGELVYGFRWRQVAAIIDWLDDCRQRFA